MGVRYSRVQRPSPPCLDSLLSLSIVDVESRFNLFGSLLPTRHARGYYFFTNAQLRTVFGLSDEQIYYLRGRFATTTTTSEEMSGSQQVMNHAISGELGSVELWSALAICSNGTLEEKLYFCCSLVDGNCDGWLTPHETVILFLCASRGVACLRGLQVLSEDMIDKFVATMFTVRRRQLNADGEVAASDVLTFLLSNESVKTYLAALGAAAAPPDAAELVSWRAYLLKQLAGVRYEIDEEIRAMEELASGSGGPLEGRGGDANLLVLPADALSPRPPNGEYLTPRDTGRVKDNHGEILAAAAAVDAGAVDTLAAFSVASSEPGNSLVGSLFSAFQNGTALPTATSPDTPWAVRLLVDHTNAAVAPTGKHSTGPTERSRNQNICIPRLDASGGWIRRDSVLSAVTQQDNNFGGPKTNGELEITEKESLQGIAMVGVNADRNLFSDFDPSSDAIKRASLPPDHPVNTVLRPDDSWTGEIYALAPFERLLRRRRGIATNGPVAKSAASKKGESTLSIIDGIIRRQGTAAANVIAHDQEGSLSVWKALFSSDFRRQFLREWKKLPQEDDLQCNLDEASLAALVAPFGIQLTFRDARQCLESVSRSELGQFDPENVLNWLRNFYGGSESSVALKMCRSAAERRLRTIFSMGKAFIRNKQIRLESFLNRLVWQRSILIDFMNLHRPPPAKRLATFRALAAKRPLKIQLSGEFGPAADQIAAIISNTKAGIARNTAASGKVPLHPLHSLTNGFPAALRFTLVTAPLSNQISRRPRTATRLRRPSPEERNLLGDVMFVNSLASVTSWDVLDYYNNRLEANAASSGQAASSVTNFGCATFLWISVREEANYSELQLLRHILRGLLRKLPSASREWLYDIAEVEICLLEDETGAIVRHPTKEKTSPSKSAGSTEVSSSTSAAESIERNPTSTNIPQSGRDSSGPSTGRNPLTSRSGNGENTSRVTFDIAENSPTEFTDECIVEPPVRFEGLSTPEKYQAVNAQVEAMDGPFDNAERVIGIFLLRQSDPFAALEKTLQAGADVYLTRAFQEINFEAQLSSSIGDIFRHCLRHYRWQEKLYGPQEDELLAIEEISRRADADLKAELVKAEKASKLTGSEAKSSRKRVAVLKAELDKRAQMPSLDNPHNRTSTNLDNTKDSFFEGVDPLRHARELRRRRREIISTLTNLPNMPRKELRQLLRALGLTDTFSDDSARSLISSYLVWKRDILGYGELSLYGRRLLGAVTDHVIESQRVEYSRPIQNTSPVQKKAKKGKSNMKEEFISDKNVTSSLGVGFVPGEIEAMEGENLSLWSFNALLDTMGSPTLYDRNEFIQFAKLAGLALDRDVSSSIVSNINSSSENNSERGERITRAALCAFYERKGHLASDADQWKIMGVDSLLSGSFDFSAKIETEALRSVLSTIDSSIAAPLTSHVQYKPGGANSGSVTEDGIMPPRRPITLPPFVRWLSSLSALSDISLELRASRLSELLSQLPWEGLGLTDIEERLNSWLQDPSSVVESLHLVSEAWANGVRGILPAIRSAFESDEPLAAMSQLLTVYHTSENIFQSDTETDPQTENSKHESSSELPTLNRPTQASFSDSIYHPEGTSIAGNSVVDNDDLASLAAATAEVNAIPQKMRASLTNFLSTLRSGFVSRLVVDAASAMDTALANEIAERSTWPATLLEEFLAAHEDRLGRDLREEVLLGAIYRFLDPKAIEDMTDSFLTGISGSVDKEAEHCVNKEVVGVGSDMVYESTPFKVNPMGYTSTGIDTNGPPDWMTLRSNIVQDLVFLYTIRSQEGVTLSLDEDKEIEERKESLQSLLQKLLALQYATEAHTALLFLVTYDAVSSYTSQLIGGGFGTRDFRVHSLVDGLFPLSSAYIRWPRPGAANKEHNSKANVTSTNETTKEELPSLHASLHGGLRDFISGGATALPFSSYSSPIQLEDPIIGLPSGNGELSFLNRIATEKLSRFESRRLAALTAIERERRRRNLTDEDRERLRKNRLLTRLAEYMEEERKMLQEGIEKLREARVVRKSRMEISEISSIFEQVAALKSKRHGRDSLTCLVARNDWAVALFECYGVDHPLCAPARELFEENANIVYKLLTRWEESTNVNKHEGVENEDDVSVVSLPPAIAGSSANAFAAIASGTASGIDAILAGVSEGEVQTSQIPHLPALLLLLINFFDALRQFGQNTVLKSIVHQRELFVDSFARLSSREVDKLTAGAVPFIDGCEVLPLSNPPRTVISEIWEEVSETRERIAKDALTRQLEKERREKEAAALEVARKLAEERAAENLTVAERKRRDKEDRKQKFAAQHSKDVARRQEVALQRRQLYRMIQSDEISAVYAARAGITTSVAAMQYSHTIGGVLGDDSAEEEGENPQRKDDTKK